MYMRYDAAIFLVQKKQMTQSWRTQQNKTNGQSISSFCYFSYLCVFRAKAKTETLRQKEWQNNERGKDVRSNVNKIKKYKVYTVWWWQKKRRKKKNKSQTGGKWFECRDAVQNWVKRKKSAELKPAKCSFGSRGEGEEQWAEKGESKQIERDAAKQLEKSNCLRKREGIGNENRWAIYQNVTNHWHWDLCKCAVCS